jgi:hypothetical protein
MNSPQSGGEPIASRRTPNILTVRIYNEKRRFVASFKERFTTGDTHKTRCSCYRIRQIWGSADEYIDTSPSKFVLPEIPQRVTVLRFVFWSDANKQKAKDVCASSQTRPESAHFRKYMNETLSALANPCEAEHVLNNTEKRSTVSELQPFRTSRLDAKTISEELRTKIMTPLAPSEVQGHGLGYIYILKSEVELSTLSVLKIGFSKYHPEHRAHSLASCLSFPEVIAHTPLIPHAKRIETLIHKELVAKRKVRKCWQCGRDHREWFAITHAESREIAIRWSRWVLQQPYVDGKLSDAWRVYLQEQDFGTIPPDMSISTLWEDITGKLPRRETHCTAENQLAIYVNACYYDRRIQRWRGTPLENFSGFCEDLREVRDVKYDGLKNMNDFLRAIYNSTDFNSNSEEWAETMPGKETLLRHVSRPIPSAAASDFAAWKQTILDHLKELQSIKTGVMSVNDPEHDESPFGNATLLPVVPLNTVEQMDEPVQRWFGYTSTHQGFQLLQEEFSRRQWGTAYRSSNDSERFTTPGS